MEREPNVKKRPVEDDLRIWSLTAEDLYAVADELNIELTKEDIIKIADLFSDNIDWWETLSFAIKEVKKGEP